MNLKILIIVPCFNEEKRLDTSSFKDFTNQNADFEFLFVDDGSKDGTKELLETICSSEERLNYLILDQNKGKAEAIRSGVNHCIGKKIDFDFIGYIDADLSVPLEELLFLRKHILEGKDLKFLMGIRLARLGAHIERNRIRHYMGRVFATVVSLMLHEATYDTQCGAKLIHKDLARQLFGDPFKSRWFFDVELIFRIKKYHPKVLENDQALEVPLRTWKEVGDSRLKPIDFIKAPIELLSIKSKYSSSKSKRKEPEE